MATSTQFPDDFRCPISLEIMSDPVILSSGHTFDRSSIQRWLDSGHRTCPITKLPISDPVFLIPNHALRSLISNYTLVSFPNPLSYPDPQSLIQTLIASSSSPLDSKLNTLDQLSKLSKRDSAIRRKLTESGAVSAVLNCVNSDDDSAGGLQEKALHLLLNLSLDDDNKVGLVAEGVVGRVVAALRSGAGDSRAVAATVLTSLAVVEVNKATIGAYPDAILGLISLLWGGNVRERKEAATALYTLCSFPDNRARAVENRAVPILIQNANSGLERAVEVLGLLAKCKEGRQEMMKFGGLIDVLIKFLKNGSSRAVQYALLTVNLLCSYSERMCVVAVREGMFEICVGLLEDDNEKVRRHANSLVKVLQGKRLSL
ncbi:PREDICTED: U-box domain-containing protein 8 [Nicotiana attenuata]|uniref:RING-type E3 ubiquitin transferase n=1 Tax=Nicotiana attenuata TaxID=49451 RepID=A0A314KMV3_NICAT|nr:PREDICTED: U-box domain-containing protein 8 [Nicotiana attenuata]OIT30811.1 u-box domain-containing protein 8 [Nicotiana attenuata]